MRSGVRRAAGSGPLLRRRAAVRWPSASPDRRAPNVQRRYLHPNFTAHFRHCRPSFAPHSVQSLLTPHSILSSERTEAALQKAPKQGVQAFHPAKTSAATQTTDADVVLEQDIGDENDVDLEGPGRGRECLVAIGGSFTF
eukprot:967925-Rhodomonas_salina.1